jgi:hypothetical protein
MIELALVPTTSEGSRSRLRDLFSQDHATFFSPTVSSSLHLSIHFLVLLK